MNTLRNKLTENFTIVPNVVFSDTNITGKAKSIFFYLISKPDDWQFYVDEITKNFKESKGAIQSGLKELEKYGYLIRRRQYSNQGKISSMEWIMQLPSAKNHQTENPSDGKPIRRKSTTHTNTELTKTDNTNIDVYIHRFEEFWDLYDKKLERRKCESKWKKLSSDDKESIMQFIPIYKQSVSSKQYLKHPFTFLNSRIWEDDWNNYKADERPNTANSTANGRMENAYRQFNEIFGNHKTE